VVGWFVCDQRLPTVRSCDADDVIGCQQQQLRDEHLCQLEALSSAHRIYQMQDTVKRLKASIAVTLHKKKHIKHKHITCFNNFSNFCGPSPLSRDSKYLYNWQILNNIF